MLEFLEVPHYKYCMRINEDYMDVIDREDTYDNVTGMLDRDLKDEYFCHQIDFICSGK